MPNLRLIQRTGIGYDNVVVQDATVRKVLVCNTPDGPTESTAEHTVAMLLALAKRLKQGNDNMAAGKWGPRTGALIGVEVRGGTTGAATSGPRPSGQATPAVRGAIAAWLARRDYEAVLWTALPFRMPDGRFVRPDWTDLIDHLERLDGTPRARAEEYVRRAPAMLRTPNRLRFEAVFGWSPLDASAPIVARGGAGSGAKGG